MDSVIHEAIRGFFDGPHGYIYLLLRKLHWYCLKCMPTTDPMDMFTPLQNPVIANTRERACAIGILRAYRDYVTHESAATICSLETLSDALAVVKVWFYTVAPITDVYERALFDCVLRIVVAHLRLRHEAINSFPSSERDLSIMYHSTPPAKVVTEVKFNEGDYWLTGDLLSIREKYRKQVKGRLFQFLDGEHAGELARFKSWNGQNCQVVLRATNEKINTPIMRKVGFFNANSRRDSEASAVEVAPVDPT